MTKVMDPHLYYHSDTTILNCPPRNERKAGPPVQCPVCAGRGKMVLIRQTQFGTRRVIQDCLECKGG